MKVNPLNVLNMLLAYFQTLSIEESPYNIKEIEIKDHFQMILLDLLESNDGIDMIKEESLDFQEEFKEPNAHIVEDIELHTLPEDPEFPTDECKSKNEPLSFEYKRRAVEFWRSGKTKKNLSLKTVQNRFKKVTSITQLRRWAHQINQGGTYREKIARICDYTLENFNAAHDSGFIIHDNDLRRWALQGHKLIGSEDSRFKASKWWVWKFKKAHRIVSRKITKFITKKSIENKQELFSKEIEFVSSVKQLMNQIGIENTFNSDQSGFQLEMHSGRTLAVEGETQVQCLVQSVSSTTHSYTVQPTISAEGKLLSPLFLVLQERTGTFGPDVSQKIFRPTNVYVASSKSGKLNSDLFKTWLKEIYFPNVGSTTMLLIDSWSGHCPAAVQEATPLDKTVHLKQIPTGTTGDIQPLDVLGFRVWKNFVKQFSDSVMYMDEDLNLHIRNNIIKLQSLIHNQFSSPRYRDLFKYAWYKSGYLMDKPKDFDNPVEFSFGDSCATHCEVSGCTNIAIIRCGWCKKSLCLKHFFEEYHYCSTYNP